MKRMTMLVALAFALSVGATEAKSSSPKPTGGAKATVTKTQGPKTTTGAPAKGATTKATTPKTKGPSTKAASSKPVKPAKADTKTAAATKAAKADAKLAKANKGAAKKSTTVASTTTSTGSPDAPTTTIDFTATSLGQKLEKNSAQRSKIEAKLEAAGYTGTVYEAAYGFKNLGQLNAATNQVQNHGTSFELLKVLMTGVYVDPETHVVYRANQQPDGSVKLVGSELATNPVSSLSLGQAKQSITGGAELPTIIPVEPVDTVTTAGSTK